MIHSRLLNSRLLLILAQQFDVVRLLLLTYFTPFSFASIVELEQVNVSWGRTSFQVFPYDLVIYTKTSLYC